MARLDGSVGGPTINDNKRAQLKSRIDSVFFQVKNIKVWVIGLSDLDIVWKLDIGTCIFRSMMVVVNCFNLACLSSTLTFSWAGSTSILKDRKKHAI